jgi:putative phosphoribosyl transferase
VFRDRAQAGRVLGRLIATSLTEPPVTVLALPRGGVPVGLEVARSLQAAAFGVFLVRKLGVPDQEELAFGAIASGGIRVLNRPVIEQTGLSEETIDRIARQEQIELDRRERVFGEGRPPLELCARTILLVDDGLATGATMMAAVQAVRLQSPRRVVVAVPVASRDARRQLRGLADDTICAEVPHPFHAVGCWYRNFEQVTDAEVRQLLSRFPTPSSTLHSALQTNGSTG